MQIFVKSPELIEQVIDGETVVLDKVAGLIHQLNATASTIWTACDGKATVDNIAEQIARQYGIDIELARADVETTFQQLVEQKLVQAI